MDKVKLNAAHNKLKEAVGEKGSFIIFCSSLEGEQEDMQILSGGSLVINLGVLAAMVPIAQDQLMSRLKERLKNLSRQPD